MSSPSDTQFSTIMSDPKAFDCDSREIDRISSSNRTKWLKKLERYDEELERLQSRFDTPPDAEILNGKALQEIINRSITPSKRKEKLSALYGKKGLCTQDELEDYSIDQLEIVTQIKRTQEEKTIFLKSIKSIVDDIQRTDDQASGMNNDQFHRCNRSEDDHASKGPSKGSGKSPDSRKEEPQHSLQPQLKIDTN